mgnify:FL=1
MSNKVRLQQAMENQQDLVRDFQYCMHAADDRQWQEFYGKMAREQAGLANKCLEKIKQG